MTDLLHGCEQLAELLTDSLDCGECIGYLQVLDALAAAGLTLAVDDERATSQAYVQACEIEDLLRS